MAYQYKTFTFASSDGKNHIAAHLWTPEEGAVRAIVQLVPDVLDYSTRYTALAEALTGAGYALAANDHLGHGQTARHSDDLGFFASEDGADTVITDVHKMTLALRARFRGTPVILLGQGVGSLIARLYACSYARDIEGLICFAATTYPFPRLLRLLAGRQLAKGDEREKSALLDRLVFGRYNRRVDRRDPQGLDWRSRDDETVARTVLDPFCNFRLTVSAYADLFLMAERAAAPAFLKGFPKSLPTLLVSGEDDPAGSFGKHPAAVASQLRAAGAHDVTLRLYPGVRHELTSDPDRARIFGDLLEWLRKRY